MRTFNFILFNHAMISWHMLADIIRPTVAGLNELGHKVEVGGHMHTGDVQVFIEHFPHEVIFQVLDQVRTSKANMGLILTEDPNELKAVAEADQPGGFQWKRWEMLLKTFPYFDFFWEYTTPSVWKDFVPNDRLAEISSGSYTESRPLIAGRRRFDPAIDFLIYGKQTPYRDRWMRTLQSLGHSVQYTYVVQPNAPPIPPPDYVAETLLGSAAVLLDIPRAETVKLPSASRLAFALQNGLPILMDDRISPRGTIYADHVEAVSLDGLIANRQYYLSREFRQKVEEKAADWRTKFRMAKIMEGALSKVPTARL
jgi:hypothetical protein